MLRMAIVAWLGLSGVLRWAETAGFVGLATIRKKVLDERSGSETVLRWTVKVDQSQVG